MCRAFVSLYCRRFVESRLSPARSTVLSNSRTTTYMNIYEAGTLWSSPWWRRFDFVARPYKLATKSNSTACRGRHCRQSWTRSTRSTLSKAGDFCRPNVERPFDTRSTVLNSTKLTVSNSICCHYVPVISNSRTLTGCFWWYSVKWLKPKSEWIHYILGTVRRMHGSIKIRKSGFESPITLGSDYQRSRARCTRRWRRYALKLSKKLSCHRETARCFMS